jgi:hypothetical protein
MANEVRRPPVAGRGERPTTRKPKPTQFDLSLRGVGRTGQPATGVDQPKPVAAPQAATLQQGRTEG